MDSPITRFQLVCQKQLKNLQTQDIQIFEDKPIPENYTIIARPNEKMINKIVELIDELKKFDENQFYYPPKQMHLTIIGNINISHSQEKIVQAIEEIVKINRMKFNLIGINSNIYCTSVSAIPVDFSLHEIREKLRQQIGDGDDFGKPSSFRLPEYEHVGWINFMRYLKQPKDQFLKKLYEFHDKNFGEMKVEKIELWNNQSKALNPKIGKLIYTLKK